MSNYRLFQRVPRQIRQFSLTKIISSKQDVEVVSFYDILGVKENANGLEIEDAFMEKIASPEYTVDPTNPSAANEETLEKTVRYQCPYFSTYSENNFFSWHYMKRIKH